MKNREEKRQEILRRLNANDELRGTTGANPAPAEQERQRMLNNEIEKEKEINRGWFARRFGAGG